MHTSPRSHAPLVAGSGAEPAHDPGILSQVWVGGQSGLCRETYKGSYRAAYWLHAMITLKDVRSGRMSGLRGAEMDPGHPRASGSTRALRNVLEASNDYRLVRGRIGGVGPEIHADGQRLLGNVRGVRRCVGSGLKDVGRGSDRL